jgi:hypothetical protein
MLAPFFVNLLVSCGLLLFVGWVLDVISGWMDNSRRNTRITPRLSAGHSRRGDPMFARTGKFNPWGC